VQAVDRFRLVDGSYQHNLLRDAGRLDAFAKAIAQAVKPGDVVADLGSGSGVLAFLALQAGAARVHAVEAHQHAAANLRALLALNGIADRVQVHEADAERWSPPEPVDVVVCELMETGLLHEPMAAAVRNIHHWGRKPRAFLPGAARLLVEGVWVRDDFHGYRAPLAGFRASGSGEAVTDAASYAELDFVAAPPPDGVNAAVALSARRDGLVTALRLRTLTYLTPWLTYETGPGYCTPVLLPLPEPLAVGKGEALEARLRYTFAFDKQAIAFDLRRA
jgi:predicted RNA methylase